MALANTIISVSTPDGFWLGYCMLDHKALGSHTSMQEGVDTWHGENVSRFLGGRLVGLGIVLCTRHKVLGTRYWNLVHGRSS